MKLLGLKSRRSPFSRKGQPKQALLSKENDPLMKPARHQAICTLSICLLAAVFTGCSKPAPQQSSEAADQAALANSTAFRLYVSNEVSGDLTVIDSATYKVITTVPLGKRPRGIHASPDRQTIYVALSGSPIAGPG